MLSALAAEPGIEWLGRVDDVREVWRRAAIAVLPSTYGEGVPKALLEAAACARPIVATDMPGLPRGGAAGRDRAAGRRRTISTAWPRRSPRSPAIPQRRQAMGRAGRALVEREFGEESVARQTLALYRAAIEEREARR